uniref:Calpain catalytic domain-containing protein n=1 Tax=Fusarium oxysporum (strain Fo5176) TaxID=660025 RepID=A0A0D2YDT5_FUSOF
MMNKICVAQNEKVGVYGFVFHRDGAWISTVVDDNLYLKEPDFDNETYDATGSKARHYRKQKQSNSEALFFAKCIDPNETWLPLLEKAFAKVHGDYQALDGGWAGIAMEDLTGGVATVIATNSILDKERLWRELLSCGIVGGEFLFTLSSGPGFKHRNGIVLSHTYSILEAIELKKEHGGMIRLVKIRNPWGQRSDAGHGEWYGPWADGSREWNTYTMSALHHKFGDSGIFWMTYEDVIENFDYIYRTRLLHDGWTMAQKWISTLVPWLPGFLKRKFIIDLKDKSTIIIILSQMIGTFQGFMGSTTLPFISSYGLLSPRSIFVEFLHVTLATVDRLTVSSPSSPEHMRLSQKSSLKGMASARWRKQLNWLQVGIRRNYAKLGCSTILDTPKKES